MKNKYLDIRQCNRDEIEQAIRRGDPEELSIIIVGIALYLEDRDLIEELCCELSSSDQEVVRGNAILGFGHIARRFGELDQARVLPIIEAGLLSNSDYLKGQSWAASEDIAHFLGWTISGFKD